MDAVLDFNRHINPFKGKCHIVVADIPLEENLPGFHIVHIDVGSGDNDIVPFVCVIWDDSGKPVISLCKNETMIYSPEVAKCLALRWSMEIVKGINLSKVIFQMDALQIMDCVNQIAKDGRLDIVANDCCFLLSAFLVSSVVYFPRHFNFVAHNLAQVEKVVGSKTWLGVCRLVEACPLSLYYC